MACIRRMIQLLPVPFPLFPYTKEDNGVQEHREAEAPVDERSWEPGTMGGVLLSICDRRKRWRGVVGARPWGHGETEWAGWRMAMVAGTGLSLGFVHARMAMVLGSFNLSANPCPNAGRKPPKITTWQR
jgi:hypothetical protein